MLNRRKMLQGMATGVGAAFGASLLPGHELWASPGLTTTPKRVIFFMQNQGFDPETCIPEGMKRSGSLAKAKLPEPISPLEPYKDRLHIITGYMVCTPVRRTVHSSALSAAIVAVMACPPVRRPSITS